MNTPDTTPIQLGSVAALIAALGALFAAGVEGVEFLTVAIIAGVVTLALIAADAGIRRGRSHIEANRALVEPDDDAMSEWRAAMDAYRASGGD